MRVLPAQPPVHDATTLEIMQAKDARVNSVYLSKDEDAEKVVALLAGKLGFMWWSAVGDAFDKMTSQAITPRNLLARAGGSKELSGLAGTVGASAHKAVFGSKNAGAVYVNIRWTDLEKALDAFARQLLLELGLLDEWRPLNIWYGMTMRSGGQQQRS